MHLLSTPLGGRPEHCTLEKRVTRLPNQKDKISYLLRKFQVLMVSHQRCHLEVSCVFVFVSSIKLASFLHAAVFQLKKCSIACRKMSLFAVSQTSVVKLNDAR